MNSAIQSELHLVLNGRAGALLWLTFGAIAVALLLLLLRYELRLVSRRAGLVLLGTRLLAITMLLAALFEPSAERRFVETIRGLVVMGVDLSASMDTSDPISGEDVARKSPSEPLPTISRRDTVARLLEGEWFAKIAADQDVELIGFARDSVPATGESLVRSLKGPIDESPRRLATDWAGVLSQALKADQTPPVVGVVLLTDGRQNMPADVGRSSDRLAAREVPIHSVLIGSTTPPKDVAIAAVNAPESVLKDDVANVVVTVKADGVSGVDLPVTLVLAGAAPIKQTVRGQLDGSRPVVTFAVPMRALGNVPVSIKVGPVVGDVRPENDRRDIAIQVSDDKARVLLVDGEARWELRYIHNALKRDPRVATEAVVFHQPRFQASAESFKAALPEWKTRGTPDPLEAYDAILIGDIEPADLTGDAWGRLESFVSKRGGTLILSAGPKSWPASIFSVETARKLIPILDPTIVGFDMAAPDPAHPSLARGVEIAPLDVHGESGPTLQLAANAAESREIWGGLPRQPWAVVGRAKPGATTLAVADGAGPDHSRAVIAAQRYGLGKVLWVGCDATWRWRFRVGDRYHHRFWGQVMRWAAANKLASGNEWVRFGPDRAQLSEGDSARLSARFAERVEGIRSDLLVVARIYKSSNEQITSPKADGDPVAIVPLKPVPGQARLFAATAPPHLAGRYVARLEVDRAVVPLGAAPEANLEIKPRETSELVELAASRETLESLASVTGGRVFTVPEADQLHSVLRGRPITKTRIEETTLWDRPWALAIFFATLTIEWLIRKRVGLP